MWHRLPAPGSDDDDRQALLETLPVTREDLRRWCKNLSTAAFDLKSPLTILGGYIQSLLDQELGKLNDRQVQVLQEMKLNEARLQRFIEDLSTTSAPPQRQLRAYNLNHCVAGIADVWRNRFQNLGITLYCLPGDDLVPFPFDYYRIQDVVSNLLEAALKIATPSGSVWIQTNLYRWDRCTRALHCASNRHRPRRSSIMPNAAKVTIRDEGAVIAPEFENGILRDFFRLERENEPSGLGLGLAIARRLVHLHGGTIWVDSEPGRSCEFSFLLPLDETTS